MCEITKSTGEFAKEKRSGNVRILPHCLDCFRKIRFEIQHRYYENNKDKILLDAKSRHYSTLEQQRERSKNYKIKNREVIKIRRAKAAKEKRKSDPSFRLRSNISRQIRKVLKTNGTSKNNQSSFRFIGYSTQELKIHLENQFDPWMNWGNHGYYNPSTWTWQIDHIVPQSDLRYSSMDSENFKKCWSLVNLRPLSAKENFLLGIDVLRKRKIV